MPHFLRQTINISAQPEKVWRALTDPDITRKYFFNARVLSDWTPGSPITFKGRLFWVIPYTMNGKILEIEPGRRLKYQLQNGKGEHQSTSTVTDTLELRDGKTIVNITDDVGQGVGAKKRYYRSVKGWKKILKGLKQTVEQQ
ncbi:MAG TPA: SRPBCC domain-containing protein [Chryseolinea sp.]|nr:SRPBCC domain-containing protein [Chryseolinea sp.]